MPEKEMPGLRPNTLVIWSTMSVLFFLGLYVSAKTGIRLAEERVPPGSVQPKSAVKIGDDLEAKGKFVFASTQLELRQYYFREETTAGTGIGNRGDADVFEFEGPIVMHTMGTDLNLVRVEIVTGPRVGELFWVRADSLQ